jgi:FlaA1/EpsC-like NDP-sugar epimerase
VPGRDVAVQVIGARPGEKRHEELVDVGEAPEPAGHPGIVVTTPRASDPAALRRSLREMEVLAAEGRRSELAECLRHAGNNQVVRVPADVEEVS